MYGRVGNDELLAMLKGAVKVAREATTDAIAILAEVEARGLHVEAGYASLFTYCLGECGASRDRAWRWSRAAQAVRAQPELVERLRDGRLSLGAVAVMALQPELLIDGMTKEEAQEALVAVRPKAAKKDVLSNAAAKTPVMTFSDGPMTCAPDDEPRTSHVEPVSATKSRLHCDVSKETLAKLRRAREVMGGKDVDQVLAAALDALLARKDPIRRHAARQARKEAAAAKKKAASVAVNPPPPVPVPTAPAPRRRPLPRSVADAVVAAADGQCSWTSKRGKRCTERTFCERDHVQPLAFGGSDGEENLRYLCSVHHARVTKQSFGKFAAELRRGR